MASGSKVDGEGVIAALGVMSGLADELLGAGGFFQTHRSCVEKIPAGILKVSCCGAVAAAVSAMMLEVAVRGSQRHDGAAGGEKRCRRWECSASRSG